MTIETVFFYLFAAIALASALLVVIQRNPVSSAFNLVLVFFALAGLYVMLDAHLLAALQIFVYTGAIMVLFIFVIMLLNADVPSFDLRRTPVIIRLLAGLLGGILFAGFFWIFQKGNSGLVPQMGAFTSEAIEQSGGNPRVLSMVLFSDYLFPFELTSALLLAAIVGAVALAKRKPKHLKRG